MATATEVTGPVVRMCGIRPPHHYSECPQVRMQVGLGISVKIHPEAEISDEEACTLLAQELAAGFGKDTSGTMHMIPDGCEFTVHKNIEPGGGLFYIGIYSGDAVDRDSVLASAPLYQPAVAMERVKRMIADQGRAEGNGDDPA